MKIKLSYEELWGERTLAKGTLVKIHTTVRITCIEFQNCFALFPTTTFPVPTPNSIDSVVNC